MFGRRCTLCGGKLDSQNICKECGLDNTKSDERYRLNQSDCDNQPLTHVHEEKAEKKARKAKKAKNKQVSYRTQRKTRNGRQKNKVVEIIIKVVIILFIVIGILGSIIENIYENVRDSYYEYETDDDYERWDPYEYVEATLPETGETAEYEFQSGQYIVGIHIPAGYYEAEVKDEFDTVDVTDDNNGIYLYEYEGREDNYLDDIRLYDGARLIIMTETTMTLRTDNAQTLQAGMENPQTEEYLLEPEGTYVMGSSFDAGVYDLMVMDGTGSVEIKIYDVNGEQIESYYLSMGENGSCGMVYKNLVLPEGAEVYCDGELTATLKPSPVIESMYYESYYE